jgi:hypothetical protein
MSSRTGRNTTRAIRERIERHLCGYYVHTENGERYAWIGNEHINLTALARAAQDPATAAARTQGRKRRL